jgi:hypothetical protein
MMMLRLLSGLAAVLTSSAAPSDFAGTWEGKVNDQPAVRLTLSDAAGQLSGEMVFFFQSRGQDGKWRVVKNQNGGGPILAPRLEGKLLTFEVRHHKTHGSLEYGPNKRYTVERAGPDEVRLREAGVPDESPGLKLIRVK